MRSSKPAAPAPFNCPFESLKERVGDRVRTAPSVRPVAQEPPKDEVVFSEAMEGVREIKEYRMMRPAHKHIVPPKRCGDRADDGVEALREIVGGRKALDLPRTQEYVSWINPAYPSDLLQKLHEGMFSAQDCLDLHGLVVEDAEPEVNDFLKGAQRKGYRCVKIIHGRGLRSPRGPVIKEALVKWLSGRHRKRVIGFVTARQCDGGLGAIYILLR